MITFQVTEQHAQLIINALADRPLKEVFDLFIQLNSQASAQMAPPQAQPDQGQKDPGKVEKTKEVGKTQR